MFRSRLLCLIREEAEKAGYDFHNGFLYRIARSNLRFPALWMEPPILTGVEGRDEGLLTYHLTLHLMTSDRKYPETEKEAQWETMEARTLELLRNLTARKEIFHIGKIGCTPSEYALTNRGELSLKAEFDVRFAFPYEPSADEAAGHTTNS